MLSDSSYAEIPVTIESRGGIAFCFSSHANKDRDKTHVSGLKLWKSHKNTKKITINKYAYELLTPTTFCLRDKPGTRLSVPMNDKEIKIEKNGNL